LLATGVRQGEMEKDMSDTIPDDLTREAADIVLGFAKDLTNAGAMIELVARALLSERQSSRVEELEAAP